MTPFELSVLELLRMAPTPLYSMYRCVGDDLSESVSLRSFLGLIQEMMQAEKVELWQSIGHGEGRRLSEVPADLEAEYQRVELDRTYDPFGLVLVLGSAAPEGEDPAWEVDIDFKARRFVIEGSSGAVPDDVGVALKLMEPHRFVELRRTCSGERVRIEGVVIDDEA